MEMDKLLVGRSAHKALDIMEPLLVHMLPEVLELKKIVNQGVHHKKDAWAHTLKVVEQIPKEKDLRWAALAHDLGKPATFTEEAGEVHFLRHEEIGVDIWNQIADRFKFSNERKEKIGRLIALHMRPVLYSEDWSDTSVRKLRRELGPLMPDLLALSRADISSTSMKRETSLANIQALEKRLVEVPEELMKKELLPSGTGDLIMEVLGVTGRVVGDVRKQLEGMVIEGMDPTIQNILIALEKIKELFHPPME